MGDLTVADVLERAADLIEPEGAWTRGIEARNSMGAVLLGDSPDAVCWCLIGAIRKAGGSKAQTAALPVLRKVIRGKPWDWNDRACRTQPEVVAKLREAAAIARERGL